MASETLFFHTDFEVPNPIWPCASQGETTPVRIMCSKSDCWGGGWVRTRAKVTYSWIKKSWLH